MLIIPITGKIGWRNLPWVTIGLILINILVYFAFQFNDNGRYMEAAQYYFTSGLSEIEVPRYIAYSDGREYDPTGDAGTFEELDDSDLFRYYSELEQDPGFQKKIENDEVVTPSDDEYERWKELRADYENILDQIVSRKYGFIPAYKSILTAFTYMFLHGGVGHLLGNMIFLWLVGCMLEMGCGRCLLFVLYVMGGLFAVGLFWLTNMDSIVPLVGASGSIAGFMGAFTVLYGKKRVKIFLSLGFFFHYLKIPAIILLPVWIGKEFYQLAFSDIRQIAYWAHIGGLAGGALLGFLFLKCIPFLNTDALEEEPKDQISPLLEKALKHIAELDYDAGRRLLEQVLAKDPNHTDAMVHLFNIYKLNPEDQKFHETTKKLISHLSRSHHTYEKAYEIYHEYLKHTKQPRLSPQIYLQLSLLFAASGHLENAVKILTFLLKKVPQFPGIPTALLKLANAYRQKGMAEKWKRCLQLICSKYPNSSEAQVAKRSLQGG